MNLNTGTWLNRPKAFSLTEQELHITTEPHTDLWQRSYYGFRNENAPALLFEEAGNFSFVTKVAFNYRARFDQCGVIVFIDQENWFKASIEFETKKTSRLGSVVTNQGYSDWATTDIDTPLECWYRLSRRGPDFLIESSFDGVAYQQMRIFHLRNLGETTAAMAQQDSPFAKESVKFGLYACSPSDGHFVAEFSNCSLIENQWSAHSNE